MSSLVATISSIFGQIQTQIGTGARSVTIDVLEGETYTRTKVATEHPVEDGGTISDHIQDKPDTLQLVAFFGQSLTDTVAQAAASSTRAEDLYQQLLELQEAGERLSVFTAKREYENMVIERVTRPRTRADGDGVQVTIDFKQIATATSQTVDAPPSRVKKNPKRNQGKKPKQPANAEQNQSAGAKLFDWTRAKLGG